MYRESLIECVLIDIVSYVKNKKERESTLMILSLYIV